MRRTLGTLLILVLLSGMNVMAQEEKSKQSMISVTGTNVTRVVPDYIHWSLSLGDAHKNMAQAKKDNDARMAQVMGQIAALGVKPEDVMTGTLSIRKEYFQDEKGRRTEFKEWRVCRTVTIRQRDLKRFDEFFDKLTSAGETEVGFSLHSSKIHELRWQNRMKATALARKKAEEMLAELGAKLGKPIRVDEHPPRTSAGYASSNSFTNVSELFVAPEVVELDQENGTFAPGAIEIRNTVYVTFEIK